MPETGVYGYVKATCNIEVFFPKDKSGHADLRCCLCEYFKYNSNRCAINNSVTMYPTKYIGDRCPLQFGEEVFE